MMQRPRRFRFALTTWFMNVAVAMLAAVIVVTSFETPVQAQGRDLATAQQLTETVERLEESERYSEAIPYAEKAITIYEKIFGSEHPETDTSRGMLTVLYISTGAFDKAEALLRQSFAIEEARLGGSRGRDSGRAFLVSTSSEPEGFGLYSYLLFDAPPRDEIERARYLKTLEAYLLILQPITELERFKLRSELNITLIPVKRELRLPAKLDDSKVAAQAAQEVLSEYNYARAQVLVRKLGIDHLSSGPYLISRVPAEALARELFQDMTHVAPHLAWDWVRAFCWLAAQERSWSAIALARLSLNIRNAIAVAAGNVGPVKSELANWIKVVEGRD